MNKFTILILLLCIGVLPAQVALDKRILIEPLRDNAVKLSKDIDGKEITIKFHLLKSKKAVPYFTYSSIKKNNKLIILQQDLLSAKVEKKSEESIVLSLDVDMKKITDLSAVIGANLDWNNEQINVFRGAWVPLYLNTTNVICYVKDDKGQIVGNLSINLDEPLNGAVCHTLQKNGILQCDETVK
jgi:hypothetical protein